ncbi:MAG: 2OG-Fe(II) oxygenase [Alphaproteobacteria bacterium]|nr:2OG-Fe(II) oxygenase [Alphaproteobacteria bacterium]
MLNHPAPMAKQRIQPDMLFDLDTLNKATVAETPFPYMVVPDFLPRAGLDLVAKDFPAIDMPGLFPPEELDYGPNFQAALDDIAGQELRKVLGAKFGVDLTGRPTMTTVRARARASDGKIHLDANFKIVTLLLYLNDSWEHKEGWLRALRSPVIDDFAAEVPPKGGLLFAFRCTPTAWHGHTSFMGQRRYIMMNYCESEASLARERARHRFSAKVKKFKRRLGFGGIPA